MLHAKDFLQGIIDALADEGGGTFTKEFYELFDDNDAVPNHGASDERASFELRKWLDHPLLPGQRRPTPKGKVTYTVIVTAKYEQFDE